MVTQPALDFHGIAGDFLNKTMQIVQAALSTGSSDYVDGILRHPMRVRGHMIRPFLAYTTAMAVDPAPDARRMAQLEHFAAAIELLHNASLIHDDVLDEETTRRGARCLHTVYGEKNAILAGNIYYIKAIELAARHAGGQTLRLLETAVLMCEGEILQQQHMGSELDDAVYFGIIRRKTASLTAAVARGAAEIAGADAAMAQRMELLGECVGLVYQLQDDQKDGDVLLRADFDFRGQIATLKEQIAGLLDSLPPSDFVACFDGFIKTLGGAA